MFQNYLYSTYYEPDIPMTLSYFAHTFFPDLPVHRVLFILGRERVGKGTGARILNLLMPNGSAAISLAKLLTLKRHGTQIHWTAKERALSLRGGEKSTNIDEKEVERFGDKPRGSVEKSHETRNYTNPDPLNAGLEGKNVSISLLNGKTESGKLVRTGQYFLLLDVKVYR
ncbi:MAG: hypothetical protein ACYDAZ_08145 [Thermoplasmataceae archaeon]